MNQTPDGDESGAQAAALARAVAWVAALNLAYFFVEFLVARRIGSVSLFADSIDFLEDASVNFLILIALGWSARRRAALGLLLALILLLPALARWRSTSRALSCSQGSAMLAAVFRGLHSFPHGTMCSRIWPSCLPAERRSCGDPLCPICSSASESFS